MSAPATRVPLSSLRRDGGTQIRAGLTDATVAEYQAALDAGAAFPPVVVFFDGEAHWLADGFHRVAAHEAAGLPDVLAEVRAGTKRDALLFAVGANGHHGLPRTNADKRRAVTVLLQDEEWRRESDRWIAERAAVDHKTVGRLRAEMASTGELPQSTERTGKDGRTTNTANIGKSKRDHQTPIVSDATIKAASLDSVLAAQIEAMTLATADAAYTALTHALANEEIGQDKAKALRARWTERHRALVAAKDEPPSAPPPAPPSSGQVAPEPDAPTTPEAPDAPEADDLVAQLHLLERELVGTTPAFRERARMAVAGLIADARRNRQ